MCVIFIYKLLDKNIKMKKQLRLMAVMAAMVFSGGSSANKDLYEIMWGIVQSLCMCDYKQCTYKEKQKDQAELLALLNKLSYDSEGLKKFLESKKMQTMEQIKEYAYKQVDEGNCSYWAADKKRSASEKLLKMYILEWKQQNLKDHQEQTVPFGGSNQYTFKPGTYIFNGVDSIVYTDKKIAQSPNEYSLILIEKSGGAEEEGKTLFDEYIKNKPQDAALFLNPWFSSVVGLEDSSITKDYKELKGLCPDGWDPFGTFFVSSKTQEGDEQVIKHVAKILVSKKNQLKNEDQK